MESRTKLFRIHGIDIYIHFSWWLIFILLAYSLATGYFPQKIADLSQVTYWIMGFAASLLLFLSVLLHELSHSFIAKLRKINVDSITLFFFGGIASLPSEDVEPKTEFWMALAGPLFSFALAFVFFGMLFLSLPLAAKAVVSYLAWINFVLAVFNLLPGYPLDGGRVFRALLMFYYNDIVKATWIASIGGKFIAGVLITLGFLGIFSGDFGGLWFVLIGGFIWMIAKSGYQQVLIKKSLHKLSLRSVIDKKFVSVSPEDRFDKVVELYKNSETGSLIVAEKKNFKGIVDVNYLGSYPRKNWKRIKVKDIAMPAGRIDAIGVKDSVYEAFKKIEVQGLSLLPVVEKGKVVGAVGRNRLLHLIALEVKLGG